ncbi:MAG: hypothetical protein ACE5HW_04175 [Candidatus Methanofastidiosia archaeon]
MDIFLVFFEILVYILSFFCLLNSRRKNNEFLFLSLIIYGVLLEWLSIEQFGAYSYSKALFKERGFGGIRWIYP